MKFIALPLSVAVALALSACGGSTESASTAQTAQTAPAQVSGPMVTAKATIEGLSTLSPGLSLVVKLVDVTDAASLPIVVAESAQPAPATLPINVAIGYDPAAISPNNSYALQVALQAESLVLYGTSAPVPVLTNGAPSAGLELTLVRGGQPDVNVPPTEQAKKDFENLVAGIGALRRIQGERLEADVAVGWDAFVEDSGQIRLAREQVDFGDAGSAQFRYAYKGGKAWVVERVQGNVKTLISWNDGGDVVLNEKGTSEADASEATALRARADALYKLAAAKR